MSDNPTTPWSRYPVTYVVGLSVLGLAVLPGAPDRWLLVLGAGFWSQPWGLITGHLMHGSGLHLASNLLLVLPLSLLRERDRGSARYLLDLGIIAVAVSASVCVLHPSATTYRGLSGLVYGLLAATLLDAGIARREVRPAAIMVLAALAIKTLGELAAGGWLAHPDALHAAYGVTYLAGSHAGGLIAGTALALLDTTRVPRTATVRSRGANRMGLVREGWLRSVRRARALSSVVSACDSPRRRR